MKKISFQFLVICVCVGVTSCTQLRYNRANKEFSNLEFHKAIPDYQKVIEKKDIHGAKIKLANSYLFTNELAKAEPIYAGIVEYPEIEPIEYFHYAKILMYKGDYANAKIWFDKYLAKVPDDSSALMLKSSCDSLGYFMRDTTLYNVNGIAFTELASTFGCVPYKNGIVFSAEREELKKSKQNPWTGKSFLDLYYAEKGADGKWSPAQLLKGDINGSFHEGTASFNSAGDVVYFTRSNYDGNKLQANDEDVNTLKLYKAKLVDGNWKQLEELPLNGDNYSVGQPFISKDEKTLYFIANMPGGFGGTDIYKSSFDGTTWGKPENLGMEINTAGNEMFPMMGDDSVFYFSSDAHTNMGGLDIFTTTYDETTKKWASVENLRYPINSTKDDFGYVLNNGKKTGFVSSNRAGVDKLYEFEKKDPTFNVSGIVKLKGIGTPIDGVTVDLFDLADNKKIASVLTDKNGSYKFKLAPKTKFNIVCSKETYFTQSAEVSTKKKKFSEDFKLNFETDQIVIEKAIALNNIYYDLNQWKIRKDAKVELDSLVNLLKFNPAISIEMSSYCDSRAEDEYNLKLSEKRAETTVKYLISKKIDPKRLQSKGYGETKLVNRCANGVECSDKEHQENRRTEFKVIEVAKP